MDVATICLSEQLHLIESETTTNRVCSDNLMLRVATMKNLTS